MKHADLVLKLGFRDEPDGSTRRTIGTLPKSVRIERHVAPLGHWKVAGVGAVIGVKRASPAKHCTSLWLASVSGNVAVIVTPCNAIQLSGEIELAIAHGHEDRKDLRVRRKRCGECRKIAVVVGRRVELMLEVKTPSRLYGSHCPNYLPIHRLYLYRRR